MTPHALANQISSLLYGRRFGPYFVGPVVAGLNESNEPYLAAFDLLGAGCMAKDFVVNGTTSEQLYGCCEAFWRPGMTPEELQETISQCLMAAVDRDCLTGWGAVVHIITPDSVKTLNLRTRMD